MKKKAGLLIGLFLFPLLVAAGEGSGQYFQITGRENDMLPRIFNFLVFAGLLYYLIADPVRNFFESRRRGIASRLEEIERRLREAKEARKSAEQTLSESTKKAEEILKDAQKEAEVLQEHYRVQGARELETLEAQYRERMEREERKMQRETIVKLLDENISTDNIPLGASQVIQTLAKKVA